jgi:hypothetical protein
MKNALGVSIALVAVLWTWLVLAGPLNGIALVWAGFIAWGAYFTVGKQALGKTIAATIFGSLMAIVAVYILALTDDYLGQFAAPVAIGITVYVLTAVPKLNNIPANVLGFAATFGWLLTELIALEAALASDGGTVIQVSMGHPFVLMSSSFVGGAIMAKLSEMLASKLG